MQRERKAGVYYDEIISSVIVGIILLALVFLVIRSMVRDKKAGKGICGGDCSACKGCHCK